MLFIAELLIMSAANDISDMRQLTLIVTVSHSQAMSVEKLQGSVVLTGHMAPVTSGRPAGRPNFLTCFA